MLFGTVAATIANTARNPKKKPTPYTWRDIFPRWDNKVGKTVDEQLATVEALNAMFGGVDLRKDKASTA